MERIVTGSEFLYLNTSQKRHRSVGRPFKNRPWNMYSHKPKL